MKMRHLIWAVLMTGTYPACPAIAASVDTNAVVQSVFVLPSDPSEGRDPFFPNSMRPYESAMAKRHNPVDVTSLRIRGFSEIAGHRYVIINNHTFGDGDEGDVITPEGRVHIRCLHVGTDSVLVESAGSQHILQFTGNQ